MSTKQAERSAERIHFSVPVGLLDGKKQVRRKSIVITSWLYIDLSKWALGFSAQQEIARDARRITAAEMKYMRRTAG